MFQSKKILFGITGSIACYKAADLISTLVQRNCDVRVIATSSSLQFIGKATLEGLTGQAVITSDYEDGKMMSHIDLGKWADIFIIAPATAQSLNSLSLGIGNGPLISTYLAYDTNKPLYIAPAMNSRMYQHPTTQRSIQFLSQQPGCLVLPSDEGSLACGEVGIGRMLPAEKILHFLDRKEQPGKKLLVSAGGTSVPIDSVRSITNTSTGRTGAQLVDYLSKQGHEVTLITNKHAVLPTQKSENHYYNTYDELYQQMKNLLSEHTYDAVIHAAAVSDYTVTSIITDGKAVDPKQKISSSQKVSIELSRTEKIIAKIKTWAKDKPLLVGFKLTNTNNTSQQVEAIQSVFNSGADIVVHNDLGMISDDNHSFFVFHEHGASAPAQNHTELCEILNSSLDKKPTEDIPEASL